MEFSPKLDDLDYAILKFANDNPDGIIQEEFFARLVSEHYIYGNTQTQLIASRERLFTYGCLVNYFVLPNRRIFITPNGGKLLYSEIDRRTEQDKLEQITISKLKHEQKNIKYWWAPILISIAALVSSVVIPVCQNYVDNSGKDQTKEQIGDLERKLQQTNTNVEHQLDSLWKRIQILDTANGKP